MGVARDIFNSRDIIRRHRFLEPERVMGGDGAGHAGGPGRKPKAQNERYLKKLHGSPSKKDFGEIVGALVDKAKSGDVRAAELLLKYAIGKPIEYTPETDAASSGEGRVVSISFVTDSGPKKGDA